MVEVEASPDCLHGLLKLKRGKTTGSCDFCHQVTNPPHNYLNCPQRPCYLCYRIGHLQTACPFRLSHGAAEAALKALLASRSAKSRPLRYTQASQLEDVISSQLVLRSAQCSLKVVAAVRKAHEKRVTCLEFIPGSPCQRVLSTDKRGNFVTWNFGIELANGEYMLDTQRSRVHHCNVNALQFQDSNIVFSSSSDGTVARSDLNMLDVPGASHAILNLNPNGFVSPKTFKMAYGMCLSGGLGSNCGQYIVVGDETGNLYRLDPRAADPVTEMFRGHKGKVQHADANIGHGALFCTGANDKTVKVWDARQFDSQTPLVTLEMKSSVSAATFSPRTGTKLLVTTLDNKIYIWKDVHSLGSDGDPPVADIDITHSHQFNRYLSNSKAFWDPKDWREDLFLCGRYLGEAYNVRGKPCLLHPIDLFSASSGSAVATLVDGTVGTVCSINRFHPTEDAIVTGSSQHLFLWGVPQDSGHDGLKMDEPNEDNIENNEDVRNLTPAERKRQLCHVDTSVLERPRRRARRG